MYPHKQKSFPLTIILTVLLFIFFTIFILSNINSVSDTAAQTQADSLQRALMRSAVHCYAAEGRYPESLEYLQEEYGICWDSEQYVVDYEVFASNLLPSISVIPLS